MDKKFLIVPACTDLNRGDQALVWESAFLLKDAFGENTIVKIVDYGNSEDDRIKQSRQTKAFGFDVVRNIIENPKRKADKSEVHSSKWAFCKAAFTAVTDFIKHLILIAFPSKEVFKGLFKGSDYSESFDALLDSDCVVIKGGGYLHTYGKPEDLYYLWFGLYYVLLAKRLRKKVIMLPNSIGPITGTLNRLFFNFVVKKIDLLYVREKISLSYIKKLGLDNGKYGFDLGYYAKREEIGEGKKKINKNEYKFIKIGITLRPYRFPNAENPHGKYLEYINAIANFCNSYPPGNKFYFIVQVQGPSAHETDLIAINDVVERINPQVEYEIIDDDYNYKELMSIYKEMDFVVGTRFHSVIFSQIVGTPALAIAYGGNKSRGIMRELDLEEYVIDIDNIDTTKLKFVVDELLKGIDDYKLKLSKIDTLIEADRQKIIQEIKMVIN